MSRSHNLPVKILIINVIVCFVLSACSLITQTKTTSSAATASLALPLKQCGQYAIDNSQSCLMINDRVTISYADPSQSQYSGIAIFLHGAPGSPEKVADIFGAKMIAKQFNLVSLAPQGNGSGYQWHSTNNTTENNTDIDYLLALIARVQSQYRFSDDKIYIFGYSAGGFMAYKLACQIPARLTAVISLAGQYRGDFTHCATSVPVAIHHLHSMTDQDVPFNGRSAGSIASVPDTMAFWQHKNTCGNDKSILIQAGVTALSTKTTTELYTGCSKSIGLSILDSVEHEDSYSAEKLMATYQYLFNE